MPVRESKGLPRQRRGKRHAGGISLSPWEIPLRLREIADFWKFVPRGMQQKVTMK